MPPKFKDKAIRKMRKIRGLSMQVASVCGIDRAAVYQWRKIPANRVHDVAPILDMTPEEIRPDVFRPKR
jgi:pyruvate kinase